MGKKVIDRPTPRESVRVLGTPFLHSVARTLKGVDAAALGVGIRGGMGVALYMSHYFKAFQDLESEDVAGCVLEQMIAQMEPDMPFDFVSGVSGFGSGMLYLRSRGFIELDTAGSFLELDSYLGTLVPCFTSADIGLSKGLLGLGKYFSLRMSCAERGEDLSGVECSLKAILDALGRPYLSVTTLTEILDFLCELYSLGIQKFAVESLLSMYVEQLHHVVLHCIRYRAYGDQFSLLSVASVFARVWEKTGSEDARAMAEHLLKLRMSAYALHYQDPNDLVFWKFLSRRPGVSAELLPPVSTVSSKEGLVPSEVGQIDFKSLAVFGLRSMYLEDVIGDELFDILPLSYWCHDC